VQYLVADAVVLTQPEGSTPGGIEAIRLIT